MRQNTKHSSPIWDFIFKRSFFETIEIPKKKGRKSVQCTQIVHIKVFLLHLNDNNVHNNSNHILNTYYRTYII